MAIERREERGGLDKGVIDVSFVLGIAIKNSDIEELADDYLEGDCDKGYNIVSENQDETRFLYGFNGDEVYVKIEGDREQEIAEEWENFYVEATD